jgi:hypothetical protein
LVNPSRKLNNVTEPKIGPRNMVTLNELGGSDEANSWKEKHLHTGLE